MAHDARGEWWRRKTGGLVGVLSRRPRLLRSSSEGGRGARLRLDARRRVAVIDGRRVHLTAREFHLLSYLVQKRGRTCSRPELFSNVWRTLPRARDLAIVDDYTGRINARLGVRLIEGDPDRGYSYDPGDER